MKMIEFQAASLIDNRQDSEIWQGLNAALIALQQSAQSETAVYQVFSEQIVKLGLHGTVSLLDDSGQNLQVVSMVFAEKLMKLVRKAEKVLGTKSLEFTYPANSSKPDEVVLIKGDVVFLPNNTEKLKQVFPPNLFQYAAPFMKPFLNIPAIMAPLFAQSKVIGVLYLASANLNIKEVPIIAAFATHLSVALENARLFQAMQTAEAQYRHLFDSVNDGIFSFDPEARQLLSANPMMLRLLGIDQSDMNVVRPTQLVGAKIAQMYEHQFETAMRKGQYIFNIPFVDQAGDQHLWQVSTNLTEQKGRPVLNGVVRDITKAKQAEDALRQREEQFRILAENVPGTIYLVKNEEDYPLLYINDGIEALTGFPKEKFIRGELAYKELIHPEDQDESGYSQKGLNIAQDEPFRFVYRVQHRSGRWYWVEDVGGAVFDEKGNILFLEGVITDITDRVQSDLLQKTLYRIADVATTTISLDELYRSIHEALAQILDVTNFYIALYDEPTEMIEVPYFVDKYDTCLGAYRAGRGLTELVVRTNRSQLLTNQQIKAEVAQGNLMIQGTIPQVWLGVPLRSQEKAVGALVVQSYEELTAYSEQDRQFLSFVSEQIANAIERKQAEERQRKLSTELKQQTRLLEAILAATPDNFLVFDLDGRFLFISNTILDYLDVSVDAVVGKSWQALNLPPYIGELSDRDRTAVLQTGEAATSEFVFPLPDGEREIEFVTNPVLGADGEVTAFVTTARDNTQLKQTMRAMNRSQKMESLGILAGGIAQDFNNLLVAMLGQASIAQAHLSETDSAYNHVRKAVKAAEQASNLTRQLLAYSGGGKFLNQPLALNDLILESSDLLKVALPKQVNLQLNLTPELPLIEGDVSQIQQVLMNLIINAAEAVGDHEGTVQMETAVCKITKQDHRYWRYTNQPLTPRKYIKLSVKDSGEGMDKETQTNIFDPFFTTKFTGRGLGLAAVLGIIRSHDGGLHVDSLPGQGTAFELLFPITAIISEISEEEPAKMNKSRKGLVLVIDDEKAVREAVADILEIEEIDVLTAANGDEGINLYKAHADAIDLILLDLSMPGKSGQETFAELSAFDPNVRILLSSGYSEDLATRGFDSPSLVGFLQKPYRLNTFVNRLNQYL